MIINLFEDRYIKLLLELEFNPKFEQSIAERTKMKRQKKSHDEQPGTTDMPDLESEKSAEQRRKQKEQGLKMLTPNQMLSRLPITLAQLKAGNNSEKLKNEIRKLLYSLYRSKKISQNHL